MPSPKDLTDDLSRLNRKPLVPHAGNNPPSEPPHPRPMAFDPLLWLTLFLLAAAVASQITLFFWSW